MFLRLKPEHATEQGLIQVRARAAALAQVPGVLALTIGEPADQSARGAWATTGCICCWTGSP